MMTSEIEMTGNMSTIERPSLQERLQDLDAEIRRRQGRLKSIERDGKSRNVAARQYYESIFLQGRLKVLEERIDILELLSRRSLLQMEVIKAQSDAAADQESLDNWAANP